MGSGINLTGVLPASPGPWSACAEQELYGRHHDDPWLQPKEAKAIYAGVCERLCATIPFESMVRDAEMRGWASFVSPSEKKNLFYTP